MAFWSVEKHKEPLKQYRWYIDFNSRASADFGGLDDFKFALKECKKPEYEISMTKHRLLTHTLHYPGLLEWKPITIKFVSALGEGNNSVSSILNRIAARAGYFIPAENRHQGISKLEFENNLDTNNLKIVQVDEEGRDIEIWELYNALIKDVSYGSLSYSSEDFVEVSVTIQYDWAVLKTIDSEDSGELPIPEEPEKPKTETPVPVPASEPEKPKAEPAAIPASEPEKPKAEPAAPAPASEPEKPKPEPAAIPASEPEKPKAEPAAPAPASEPEKPKAEPAAPAPASEPEKPKPEPARAKTTDPADLETPKLEKELEARKAAYAREQEKVARQERVYNEAKQAEQQKRAEAQDAGGFFGIGGKSEEQRKKEAREADAAADRSERERQRLYRAREEASAVRGAVDYAQQELDQRKK